MNPDFEVIIVGAGVVGLAIARALALDGRSVLLVERAPLPGSETSSRSSEVIHAGIYYPPGSLKAGLCVAGRTLLYDFCAQHAVPHRRCGKLIVATDETQIAQLEDLKAKAAQCGVTDLRLISARQAKELEPEIACTAALLSPSTGIVDTHALTQALSGVAENCGAAMVCNTEVTGIAPVSGGWAISVAGSDGPVASARAVVNSAGLAAETVARHIEGFPQHRVPRLRFAKGCYFRYARRTNFRHLVYPVPEPGGLGTHLTLDLAGATRFGPDVEWVDEIDYRVDCARRDRFTDAIRRFWPAVEPAHLHPDYAGVRPKLSGPLEPTADFLISGPRDHGVAGILNLFGIESPGITASLAIATHVRDEIAVAD